MSDFTKGQVLMDKEEGEYVLFLAYVWDDDYRMAKIGIPQCGDTEVVEVKRLRGLTKRERGTSDDG